ncbi:MAG TPA: creatininase family protein [Candidatus Ozemobacteraceae bacterium]|nr:creatininase family protein [Candidatus Ozemobacteraceae bacterium]
MNLSTVTAAEIAQLDREQTIVFLPLGPAEQHGPHLPIGTKVFIAEALAFEASNFLKPAGLTCLTAPSLPFAPCQVSFGIPGTFSLNARAFSDFLFEIGQSFQREGFRWFFLVNHSVSLECLKACETAISDLNRLRDFHAFDPLPALLQARTPQLEQELKNLGCAAGRELHADARETSAMMYLDADLVDGKVLPQLPPHLPNLSFESLKGNFSYVDMGAKNGYVGTPSAGTPEFGKLYIETAAAGLAESVRKALAGQPLPQLPIPIRMLLKLVDLDETL